MADLYQKFKAGIEKAEKATGKTLYKPFVATRTGTLDPVTDTTTPALEITGKAITESYTAAEIDGDLIKSTDYKMTALVPDLSAPIAIGDIIEGARVHNLDYQPADPTEAIAVTLQMRRV